MKRAKSTYLALIAILLTPMAANADLISVDWQSSGDNLLTRDTESGLEWLDLSETYNQTVADVLPLLATTFDGFRLALADEVHELMGHAGIPFNTTTAFIAATAAELAAADALTALLSETVGQHFGSQYYGSRGHLDNGGTDLVVGYYRVGEDQLFNDYFSGFDDWPGAGVWLVRSTAVPEPGTLALLGIGLLGMGLARRGKKA